MTLLSIIMPVYNKEEYIDRAIQSITVKILKNGN